jgi:hypothetical protein
MLSAHPTMLSLLIGAVGLPAYALAVWTQLWSPLDLLGLALVFVAIGHVAPMWQPVAWKGGKANANANQQKVDWKAVQEALKMARAQSGTLSPAQQLEAQRRQARLLSGLDTPLVPAGGSNTSTRSAEPERASHSSAVASQPATGDDGNGEGTTDRATTGATAAQAAGNDNARGRGGCSLWFFFWIGIQFFNWGRVGANPLAALWQGIQATLPSSVTNLFGAGVLLSWPLLTARVVTSPLPFFAFALPPAVLLVPLWIGFARLRTWGLASQVSASETFWTMRRARERKAAITVLWLLSGLFFAGYSWRGLIEDGALAGVLRGAWPTPGWALAAAWTVALVLGALVAGQMLEAPFTRVANGGLEQRAAWREATLGVSRVLAWSVALYFVFCWLGLRSGLGGVWWSRLLPTMLTVAAFVLADFGSAALQSTLEGGPRAAFRVLRWAWSIGLALEAAGRAMIGFAMRDAFAFERAPHVLLSPFVTLFGLFRSDLSPAISPRAVDWWPAELVTMPWWIGPLAQALIGVLCLAVAARMAFGAQAAEMVVEAATTRNLGQRVLDVLLMPFKLLWRVLRAVVAFFGRGTAWIRSLLARGNEAVISRLEQIENPVLTAEVRRKTRRNNWCLHWLIALVVAVAVFVSVALPLLLFDLVQGGGISPDWGRALAYITLLVLWFLAGLSVSDGGQAFDRDRANGTLVFLFLTPLSDGAILTGKALAQFAYALPVLLIGVPWLLIGCLAASAAGAWPVVLVTGFGIATVLSTLVFAVYVQTLFAVRARKPTEGAAKALLAGLVIEIGAGASLLAAMGVWGDTGLCAALFGITLLHLALAYACWQWSLHSMRKQRYGDVTASGKTVA